MSDEELFCNKPIPRTERHPSCLAVTEDLIFASKIQSAARFANRPCSIARSLAELEKALHGQLAALIFVDMALETDLAVDAIKLAKQSQPNVPVIAFYAHVQPQLARQAIEAGADRAMPRSQFVVALPELVAG